MNDHITSPVEIPENSKRCTKCGEVKPRAEFYTDRQKRDGLTSHCMVCCRGKTQHYIEANRDKVRERERRWRAEHANEKLEHARRYRAEHAEEESERSRRWRAEHAEEKREYARRYRIEHREEENERCRRWRTEHPEEVLALSRRRRARKATAPGFHTAEDIRLQCRAQTDKKGRLICWWCDKPIEDKYHVDHRIPLAKGGSNWPENIVLTHARCNLSKSNKLPGEFNGRLL